MKSVMYSVKEFPWVVKHKCGEEIMLTVNKPEAGEAIGPNVRLVGNRCPSCDEAIDSLSLTDTIVEER